MAQYINKDALVAEIEKLISNGKLKCQQSQENNDQVSYIAWSEHIATCGKILLFLDNLEAKESDMEDELQGLEKEVAEGTVNRINEKRISIELKGEKKAKFKNEFNTLWQTIDGIQFANVAKHIIERLCLHFAAWGVYNLKEYIKMKPEEEAKLDVVKVKEVDLEKELSYENYMGFFKEYPEYGNGDWGYDEARIFANYFFKLGLKVKQESNDDVKIGETQIYLEDDGGEPPYDGKQWLDLSCTEYEIPKTLFKDGDNVEILIHKTQKGE